MDSTTLFVTILTSILSSGVFAAVAKYLLSIELEYLKSDLSNAAFQKQTTFARLHEKRAEIIAELYCKLTEADRATKMLLFHDILSQDELKKREKEAFVAIGVFNEYIDTHQLYFEEPLCNLLNDLTLNFMKGWATHKEAFLPDQDRIRIDPKERKEAWQYFSQQVPPIRKEIEATFRKLLGHTPSSATFPDGQ